MPRKSVHPLWGSFAIDRRSGVSLQEQIAAFYRSAIGDGRLPAGARVEGSRRFAADQGISRTTVVEAYQRLVDEGYLVTRLRAGMFVADTQPGAYMLRRRQGPRASGGAGGVPDPDLRHIDMRTFELPLAPGMPAIDRFPWPAWMRILNRLCRERPLNALGYGDPQGELLLRRAIAEYLAAARGIVCNPGQIVVTSGSEQTIAFAAAQAARGGGSAWFENPSYPMLWHALRTAGLDAMPVPVDEHGLNVDEGLRRDPTARLAVVSPTHQYPLGISMSEARRRELLAWSQRSQSWILENEIDGDYRFSARPLPSLYALANGGRVIYCGSLSKPLAPGLRVNYLVAPADAVGAFGIQTTLVPPLTQLALARFNDEGHLAAHMNRMRRLYAKRRAILLDALRARAAGLLDVDSVPEAGLRVAAALPPGANDVRIAADCLDAGIRINPLSTCYASEPRRPGLIMGFASTAEESIEPAVCTLVRVIERSLR